MIEPFLSDEAFLADLESAPRSPDRLDIWWLGQSGYIVQMGTRLCIDPYLSDALTRKYADTAKPHVRMTRRVVDPNRLADIKVLLSTHAHTDHLDADTLNAIRAHPSNRHASVVYPRANTRVVKERLRDPLPFETAINTGESVGLCGIEITAVPALHEPPAPNGDGELPCLGYVFRGPFTVYHSGDGIVFPGMATLLKPFAIDLALLPINGKVGNMNGADAARLAHDIGAKLVVPCHYDMFEFNTASPEELFIPECERLGQPYKVLRAGERLTLTK